MYSQANKLSIMDATSAKMWWPQGFLLVTASSFAAVVRVDVGSSLIWHNTHLHLSEFADWSASGEVQARCQEEVRQRGGAEAREAATAEEKNQLKAGLREALEGKEALDRDLAAAQAQAEDLHSRVPPPPSSSPLSLGRPGRVVPLWPGKAAKFPVLGIRVDDV